MSRRVLYPLSLAGLVVALAIIVPISLGRPAHRRATHHAGTHCAAHFPKLIRDGFPEPRMLFSRRGVLNVSLRATEHTIRLNHQTVDTMEYDNSLPGPTLVACPGDRVTVHLGNSTSSPMNLHVHGLHV